MIYISKAPIGDQMYTEANYMSKIWLDYFNKLSQVISGSYEYSDGIEVDNRKVTIYKIAEGINTITLPVEVEGFVNAYDVDTNQVTQIYVNSKELSLPSYAGKLIIQGILKRL